MQNVECRMQNFGQRFVLDVYRFTRFSAFGATAVLPLLGAGLAGRRLAPAQIAHLLGVAAAFHVFAYVDNDLVDLDLDRGQPLRAAYPLVRGAVGPRTARAISLGALAAAFLFDQRLRSQVAGGRTQGAGITPHAPRSTPHAMISPHTALVLACALMALYNRYGKRCPLPPLTDAVQGLGWAALIAYGADGRVNRPVAWLMLHELLLILLVNGVHGPLRDLANDAANGARTTARWLGARVDASGALHIPPALGAYALALQSGMAGSLIAVLYAVETHTAPQRRAAALGLGACLSLTGALLGVAARTRAPASVVGMLHLILILSAPVALVAPALNGPARAALLAAHGVPLLANGLTFDALRWLIDVRPKHQLR
jgi:4-hydroxybenzoate polyprenyltransferase